MHRQMGRRQTNRKLVRDARAEKHSKVKIFQAEQVERAMEAFLDTDTAAAIDRALSGELSVDREHRRCGAYGIITVKKTPKK